MFSDCTQHEKEEWLGISAQEIRGNRWPSSSKTPIYRMKQWYRAGSTRYWRCQQSHSRLCPFVDELRVGTWGEICTLSTHSPSDNANKSRIKYCEYFLTLQIFSSFSPVSNYVITRVRVQLQYHLRYPCSGCPPLSPKAASPRGHIHCNRHTEKQCSHPAPNRYTKLKSQRLPPRKRARTSKNNKIEWSAHFFFSLSYLIFVVNIRPSV